MTCVQNLRENGCMFECLFEFKDNKKEAFFLNYLLVKKS